MSNLREQILGAPPLVAPEAVKVPKSWGGTVWVRGMSAAHRDSFDSENFALMAAAKAAGRPEQEALGTNARARVLVRCLCDETGALLFNPDDPAEADLLGARDTNVIERLARVARRLSALGDKAAEEAEGGSSADPSGASSTN